MSVHRKKERWVVRWREEDRNRSRSFSTKAEADAYDRRRQRDDWRESVAKPVGAVAVALADKGVSFLVCESLGDAQRPIHDGFFRTIKQADAYRRQMPDADALSIVLLHDRYPSRDLTEAEIAAGAIDPSLRDPIADLLAKESV